MRLPYVFKKLGVSKPVAVAVSPSVEEKEAVEV